MARSINYYGFGPKEERLLRGYVKQAECLLPVWLQRLDIGPARDQGVDGAAMDVMVEYEYRRATVQVYQDWFRGEKDEMLHAVRHEFLHIVLAPYTNLAEELIKSPKMTSILGKAEEGVIQDLVDIITRALQTYRPKR